MRRGAVCAVTFVLVAAIAPGCGAMSSGGRASAQRPGVVRILIGGDVLLGRAVGTVVAEDPSSIFFDIQTQVRSADIAIANLESPVTARPPVAGRPNALEADPAAAAPLAAAGFDAMSVANNHAGDAGLGGFLDTLDALRGAGIDPLGGGEDAASATAPTVLDRNGVRVALLTFDATLNGPEAGSDRPGVAWWSPAVARSAIANARASADVVVVGLHGGTEYSSRPDAYIGAIARRSAAWGADVVWASGPHVVQPVRVLPADPAGRRSVIATSLGNLVFDQTQPGTTTGALLEVLAGRDGVLAERVGATAGGDLRAHFTGWVPPSGDAGELVDGWWSLLRPVVPAVAVAPERLPRPPGRRATIVAAAVGDVDGDGHDEIVVAYRSAFHPTRVNALYPHRRWTDRKGLAAHLGIWRAGDLAPVWIAGTVLRPVTALAVCGRELAVAYSTLLDPRVVAVGVWRWNGFGFASATDLAGPGRPACADVDRDGSLDAAFLGRSSPALEGRGTS